MSAYDLPRITLSQAATRPSLDFVLPGLLAGSGGLVVGQGAVGKSFLALQIGLAVASGKPVAGGLWPAPQRGPVTIVFGEDQPTILQERLYWLREAEGISHTEAEEIDALLDIRGASGFDLRLITKSPAGLVAGQFFDSLRALARGQRLVILDPLAFLHDADENDNGAATRLMQTIQSVCRETGATIIILHHVSKGAGGDGREDWASARGASALTTAARWQVNLTLPTKKEMDNFGIDEEMRGYWVRVALVKSNYGPPAEPGWLQRVKGGVLRSAEILKAKKPATKKTGKGADDEDDF